MNRLRLTAGAAVLLAVCAAGAPLGEAGAAAPTRTVQLWMAGRLQPAQRFVDAVSAPGSPRFRRFVSPSAYTQRFGPSASQVATVESYLRGAGFRQVHASINDVYVSGAAPATDRRPLALPGSIRGAVLAATGLAVPRRSVRKPARPYVPRGRFDWLPG